MLQIFQLEVDVCFCKPAVIWGIIEDGFSYVGPNPFFGGNDFFGDIHKAFSGSEFKGSGFKVQPSRRPKKRPVKSRERNYIFVINDEVSYEGFEISLWLNSELQNFEGWFRIAQSFIKIDRIHYRRSDPIG